METLTAANARLVDAQARLPLAQAWGGGRSRLGRRDALRGARAHDSRRAGTANTTARSAA
ncbi:MAG: hypothetical protein WKG07_38090 [Hymenobacter sp.]